MDFNGKVALVTGGNSGIGEAIAWRFARSGAKVLITGTNSTTGEAVAAAMNKAGHEVVFQVADQSNEDEVRAAVDRTVDHFGRLDFAVNNAGIYQLQMQTVVDMEAAYWDKLISINLRGVFLCMKYQITAMLKTGGGSVVNISSGAGLNGVPFASGYVAAKHGVVGLTKASALDFAKQNVRVNAICPGLVKSNMTSFIEEMEPEMAEAILKSNPMERIGKPEEIAGAAAWLCSDEAAFTTGLIMPIDGGYNAR